MKNWTKGPIEGVVVKKLVKHLDERGYLTETFRLDELPENLKPVMSYVSYTEPGISRGPHEHEVQTDIFAFIGPGNFLIKLWDNRQTSTTYGNHMTIYGGQDNPIRECKKFCVNGFSWFKFGKTIAGSYSPEG